MTVPLWMQKNSTYSQGCLESMTLKKKQQKKEQKAIIMESIFRAVNGL